MLTRTLRTLLRMTITFFVIVTLVFFVTRLSGNPIDFVLGEGLTAEDREILTRYYALDRPIWDQYIAFLRGFTDGEFGLSFIERRPVAQIVAERVWPSVQLLLAAMTVTLALAIPLGIVAAVWRDRWIGSAVMSLAFFGYAIPISCWRCFWF
jgi:ABC-type dipeptide/oligopeptide/nickel transport system permease component